jgi:hypothetical protein
MVPQVSHLFFPLNSRESAALRRAPPTPTRRRHSTSFVYNILLCRLHPLRNTHNRLYRLWVAEHWLGF